MKHLNLRYWSQLLVLFSEQAFNPPRSITIISATTISVTNHLLDWFQSLKHFFIIVSCHILVASLTVMGLKTEPSELDWLQVYDMTH